MDTHTESPRSEPPIQPVAATRRHFIGMFVAAATGLCTGGLPRPLRARVSSDRLPLQDSRIVGSHHYNCDAVLDRLRIGDALRLKHQPQNPHDPRAVEVFWHSHKLGYLPRLGNAASASLLERTHTLTTEIIGLDDPDEEWEPLRLRAWVKS